MLDGTRVSCQSGYHTEFVNGMGETLQLLWHHNDIAPAWETVLTGWRLGICRRPAGACYKMCIDSKTGDNRLSKIHFGRIFFYVDKTVRNKVNYCPSFNIP